MPILLSKCHNRGTLSRDSNGNVSTSDPCHGSDSENRFCATALFIVFLSDMQHHATIGCGRMDFGNMRGVLGSGGTVGVGTSFRGQAGWPIALENSVASCGGD